MGWLRSSLGDDVLPWSWSLAPLLLLAAGVLALARRRAVEAHVARGLLLCLFPALLVGVAAIAPEAQLERVHSPMSLWMSAVALLAYCAGAAIGCAQPAPSTPGLPSTPVVARPARITPREVARRALAIAWIGAALVLVTAAPLSPAFAEMEEAWGEGAAAGAVLAAVAASALAVTSVAVFLGTLLRASDAEPPLRKAAMRVRVATLLMAALLSGTAYFTLSH